MGSQRKITHFYLPLGLDFYEKFCYILNVKDIANETAKQGI